MPISGTHRRVYIDSQRGECKYCGISMDRPEGRYDTWEHAGEICLKAPPPWSSWRVNRSFLCSLWASFEYRPFTNREAYLVYARHHARPVFHGRPMHWCGPPTEDDPFLQMNVRNTLCAAAYRESEYKLHRLGPGYYCFGEDPFPYTDEAAGGDYAPGARW